MNPSFRLLVVDMYLGRKGPRFAAERSHHATYLMFIGMESVERPPWKGTWERDGESKRQWASCDGGDLLKVNPVTFGSW